MGRGWGGGAVIVQHAVCRRREPCTHGGAAGAGNFTRRPSRRPHATGTRAAPTGTAMPADRAHDTGGVRSHGSWATVTTAHREAGPRAGIWQLPVHPSPLHRQQHATTQSRFFFCWEPGMPPPTMGRWRFSSEQAFSTSMRVMPRACPPPHSRHHCTTRCHSHIRRCASPCGGGAPTVASGGRAGHPGCVCVCGGGCCGGGWGGGRAAGGSFAGRGRSVRQTAVPRHTTATPAQGVRLATPTTGTASSQLHQVPQGGGRGCGPAHRCRA